MVIEYMMKLKMHRDPMTTRVVAAVEFRSHINDSEYEHSRVKRIFDLKINFFNPGIF